MSSSKAPKPAAESPEAREARIRYEAALIARGQAEIDAGLGIEFGEAEAWLDQLEIDPNAPLLPRVPSAN